MYSAQPVDLKLVLACLAAILGYILSPACWLEACFGLLAMAEPLRGFLPRKHHCTETLWMWSLFLTSLLQLPWALFSHQKNLLGPCRWARRSGSRQGRLDGPGQHKIWNCREMSIFSGSKEYYVPTWYKLSIYICYYQLIASCSTIFDVFCRSKVCEWLLSQCFLGRSI